MSLKNETFSFGIPAPANRSITLLSIPHVIGLIKPSGGGGEYAELIFKICATNFRRENFDEDELKNFFETILNYKAQFVDKTNTVKHIREKIEFEFPSAISLMHGILDYLIKRVEKVGLVNPESSNLFIALDEAFVNAVKHGNKFDTAKLVRISADVSPKEARFTVEDEGEGFDISSIPDPLDPENLFKTSGRGVLIIHNVMDEVKYNERGNRVVVLEIKPRQLWRVEVTSGVARFPPVPVGAYTAVLLQPGLPDRSAAVVVPQGDGACEAAFR